MSRLHGLFPGLVTDRSGLTNRLLPDANGIGTRRAKGKDSQTRLSSSFLTILSQRAAVEYNQFADRSQIVTAPQEEAAAPKRKDE